MMNAVTRQAERRSGRRAAPGFTLMEVLVTMAVFLIGMVAVASFFPAATHLQKQTVEDVLLKQASRNAEALMLGRPIPDGKVNGQTPREGGTYDDGRVHLLPAALTDEGSTDASAWKLGDRSFPVATGDVRAREFYWVPLLRDARAPAAVVPNWQIIVFILNRNSDTFDDPADGAADFWASPTSEVDDPIVSGMRRTVPDVRRAPVTGFTSNRFNFNNRQFSATPNGEADQVRPGDQIVDSNGTIHTVVDADATGAVISGFIQTWPNAPDAIWYGRPGRAGAESPTQRVLILSNAVNGP